LRVDSRAPGQKISAVNTCHCIPRGSKDFFKPLFPLLEASPHRRHCPALSDPRWLELGIARVLGDHPSGRSFLQQAPGPGREIPTCQHFFESLKSKRLLCLCRDASARLFQHAGSLLPDPLASIHDLAGFEVLAGDGHWIGHASHDAPKRSNKGEETYYPVGHFYLLDLRRHTLRHLALCDPVNRRKEHDMRAIKRSGAAVIREGIPLGKKTILVWDPAGIDFGLWHELKHGHGIYFISRTKENLSVIRCLDLAWDRADPVNRGAERDEKIGTATAGGIALLYRMRWDIEKVFDAQEQAPPDQSLGEKRHGQGDASPVHMPRPQPAAPVGRQTCRGGRRQCRRDQAPCR